MNRIRHHLSYSNVISSLCLFLLLGGGTAYALNGSNTVFSDDIVNGEVKEGDLATSAVTSGKILDHQVKNVDLSNGASSSNTIADGGIQGIDVKNETLTGTQIDESSLDGTAIGGVTPDSEVHSSGRVAVADADTGGTTIPSLIDIGTFTVDATCSDNGVIQAQLKINSSENYAISSDDGINLPSTTGQNFIVNFGTAAAVTDQRFGTFVVVASNGEALQGSYHAVANAQGADCVFAVSAIWGQ